MTKEEKEQRIKELAQLAEKDQMSKMLLGQGQFRDTGREAEGYGESIDSLIGAPARLALSELQQGNISKEAFKKVVSQIGKDPRNAPTGYDIASKVTDNPYLGAGLATAIDVGAQLPVPEAAMAPGVRGIIKELDGPLYHGTPKEFATSELKASRGGYVGPGVYMADTPNVAKGYGENLHAANVKNVKLLDLHDLSSGDALNAAKELGVEEGFSKRMNRKGERHDSTGQFYALRDALIEKIDPEYKLIGNQRAQALQDALKEKGYTGIKFLHNDKPAYSIFDEKNLTPAHKYTVRSNDGDIRLYSEPAQASGTLLGADSVQEMDPEIIDHLNKLGVSPQELFRLETLNSDVSGYGAKALKKMEESAKNRGAEYSYLNAAPMGRMGIPPGMTQESSAAKLREYYQNQGYEPVKDYGTNTMMLKKLKAMTPSAGLPINVSPSQGNNMPQQKQAFKVGEAPWEVASNNNNQAPAAFKVGEAPWEQGENEQPQEQSWLDTQLPFNTTPRGFIQGGLNALPAAGTIGGGMLGAAAGFPTGPGAIAASVGGAGLGAAAGTALKNLGESAILGQNKTRKDIYLDPAKGFLQGAKDEMTGQSIAAGIAKYGPKIAHTVSGIPEKEVETYAKNADEINAMTKSADNDVQEMADMARGKLNSQIQDTRKAMNEQISQALATKKGSIDSFDILDALETSKAQINAKLRPDEIKEVDELIGKVKSLSNKGKIGLQDAHDLKEYLQEVAEGSYSKAGQIFQAGDKTQRAAKSAGAMARKLLNAEAPEIAEANNTLSKLRKIESTMNKNMLAEGKTASSLLAAGTGGNPANAKLLERLGQVTGTDALGEAQKLAAARTFGNPAYMPIDQTGKSLTRMGIAGGLGYLTGGVPGVVAGEVLSSPAAIKQMINVGAPIMKTPGGVQGLVQGGKVLKRGLLGEGR
jgi:hypothetical protein